MKADKLIIIIALIVAVSVILMGKDSGCCGSAGKAGSCNGTACSNSCQSATASCCVAKTTDSVPVNSEVVAEVSQSQKLPVMLELGADKCIPCKMMQPILDELRSEYAGKMEVKFIDVWKNPEASEEYNIQIIPTQIFFDSEGKEIYRNEGFFSKEDILKTWAEHNIIF